MKQADINLTVSNINKSLSSKDINQHIFVFIELGFSLMKFSPNSRRKILSMIEDYIEAMETDKESIQFVLGNLLGSEMDLRFSAPILIRQCKKAKNKEGIVACLYGIYRAFLKTKNRRYINLLSEFKSYHNSDYISDHAKWLLKRIEQK